MIAILSRTKYWGDMYFIIIHLHEWVMLLCIIIFTIDTRETTLRPVGTAKPLCCLRSLAVAVVSVFIVVLLIDSIELESSQKSKLLECPPLLLVLGRVSFSCSCDWINPRMLFRYGLLCPTSDPNSSCEWGILMIQLCQAVQLTVCDLGTKQWHKLHTPIIFHADEKSMLR